MYNVNVDEFENGNENDTESEFEAESLRRFQLKYVRADKIHQEHGLMIPLTKNKAELILRALQDSNYLKRIHRKKDVCYRNPETQQTLWKRGSLRASEILQPVQLSDNPYSYSYYEKQQIVRLVNLALKFESLKKSNRSLANATSRKNKLFALGFQQMKPLKKARPPKYRTNFVNVNPDQDIESL